MRGGLGLRQRAGLRGARPGAGLLAHQGPFTPDSLVDTFEALPDLSLGIGATSGFSATNHQYSQSVWGTALNPDGSFRNLYFWSVGIPIQFFE